MKTVWKIEENEAGQFRVSKTFNEGKLWAIHRDEDGVPVLFFSLGSAERFVKKQIHNEELERKEKTWKLVKEIA